jgi:hypothetical protein
VRKNITSAMTGIDRVVRQAVLVMGNACAGLGFLQRLSLNCHQPRRYRLIADPRPAEPTSGWTTSQTVSESKTRPNTWLPASHSIGSLGSVDPFRLTVASSL